MGYHVRSLDDAPRKDLSEIDDIPPDLDFTSLTDALDLEELRAAVWYFDPGEEIQYHAHAEQEELFYVIQGEFSLKLGRSGETETRTVGPGAVWVAEPEMGHGHRYVGDDEGVVLALGAPAVDDPGLDPHALD